MRREMDEKKICFIIYKDKNAKYSDNLEYIRSLNIPDGMQIECLSIEDNESKFSAYNEGTEASDAKYKVYMECSTYIVNKNFIYDLLKIFDCDKQATDIGLVGQKGVSTQKEEAVIYGKQLEDRYGYGVQIKEYHDIRNLAEEVDYIDQMLVITAKDVRWGMDLCQAHDQYLVLQQIGDVQIKEKMVVARQTKPWCYKDTPV